MLCRGAQKPSAEALLRAVLGKDPSGNFESAKMVFAEGPLSGTQQSLCRGPGQPSAKKSRRYGGGAVDGFFAEGRPSAKKCFSLKKIFDEGFRKALGKEIILFF